MQPVNLTWSQNQFEFRHNRLVQIILDKLHSSSDPYQLLVFWDKAAKMFKVFILMATVVCATVAVEVRRDDKVIYIFIKKKQTE